MLSKLVRIGRDAELKFLQTGTPVLEINAVYDVGFGDKKESQWIKLAMFGQRAEKLAAHFVKGTQLVIYADDVKARAYTSKAGEAGCSLEAKLIDFQFAGGQPQQQAPQQGGYQQQQAPQAPQQQGGYQQQQAPQQQQGYQQQAPQQQQQQQQAPVDFDSIPF